MRGSLTTYEIDQVYEKRSDNSWALHLGGVAMLSYSATTGHSLLYRHKDRLGSAITFSDSNGNVGSNGRRFFDPFGKPRDPNGGSLTTPRLTYLNDINLGSRRGFTDHRHLDEAQLIHMNGRVYDYNLGRFMSVDPFVHEGSQGLNPYSYIMNNPLSGTDPTGYDPEEETFEFDKETVESVEVNEKGQVTINFNNGAESQSFAASSVKVGNASMDIGGLAGIAKHVSGLGEGARAELLVGGSYTKANGEEAEYGHVALRVTGENDEGAFDKVFDYGRYIGGGVEGPGILRVWDSFDEYIKNENKYGRTTTGYVFDLDNEQANKINEHFNSLIGETEPMLKRGKMKQFRLASTPYHAANCNCTTVAMDGLQAGNPSLHKILNNEKFDKGRGLSFFEPQGYKLGKEGNGIRMPLDLQAASDEYGKASAKIKYSR